MKKFELGIVIPTYNEKDNIGELLLSIKNTCDGITTVVLVVDDNSPDGTAKVVQTLIEHVCTERFEIRLLNRASKMGLGSAYKQGFTLLMPEVKNLVSMDADHSHQPTYLPEFISISNEGYDLVIGSRYVDGGGVKNWALYRQILSKGASVYSKSLLWMNVNDLTGGYNLYKSEVFEKINLNSIRAEGYLFQVEMKYKIIKSGFKFFETPIVFPDRKKGKSKISRKIILEALVGVVRLRLGK
jgi:dolichol-phosphate mannosyltransferase